ncbi:hypothetical protein DAPPUDRAFT_100870 [Daphnia pulex]|uniref:Uncharacterized protein n=1 Tax=Daphnia pulex TaxID=6669 RepID=E9GBI7_DAPPU|nr:hypothetical protein DAPPUDRAFT_100870 [Daphnia pulex]|eukprot:EFX83145.1 hypothetical protein DAPPUDRAFT_100870 [Daphnia pulex]
MEASSSVVTGKPSSTSSGGVGGGRSGGGGVGSASGSRSVSLASVSSDGSSSESHLVEQEDIVALTQEVRAFKEALGKLRRLFHPNDKGTIVHVIPLDCECIKEEMMVVCVNATGI